ncbi:MAG: hypothetical protein HRT44_01430 [Bdellovibrionales bacterium]|nr:hypothetical protein [Bdellovibrionales bacterium]NQZ17908.1 hypothetical protein [Bdellovibrionales bacterium]
MDNELFILRNFFRDWCGALSIDEIVTNEALILLIESIEFLFRQLGGDFS